MSTIKAKQNWDDAQDQNSSMRLRDQEKRVLGLQKTLHASVNSSYFKSHFSRNHLKSELKEEAVAISPDYFSWILQSVPPPPLPKHQACERGTVFGSPEIPDPPSVRHKALLSKQVYMINQVVLPNTPRLSLPALFPCKAGWDKEISHYFEPFAKNSPYITSHSQTSVLSISSSCHTGNFIRQTGIV